MPTFTFQDYFSKQTGQGQSMLVSMRIDGMEALMASIDGLRGRAEVNIPKILYRIGEQIMTDAKRQTPVDTGNLRASGHVTKPEWVNTWCHVTLGFGGPAGSGSGQRQTVGYAVYVHENLNARHKVGNAKYLERPMLAWAGKLEAKIAADLRAELVRASV